MSNSRFSSSFPNFPTLSSPNSYFHNQPHQSFGSQPVFSQQNHAQTMLTHFFPGDLPKILWDFLKTSEKKTKISWFFFPRTIPRTIRVSPRHAWHGPRRPSNGPLDPWAAPRRAAIDCLRRMLGDFPMEKWWFCHGNTMEKRIKMVVFAQKLWFDYEISGGFTMKCLDLRRKNVVLHGFTIYQELKDIY